MEATKLFINNAEFVEIAIFSPRSWNNSMVGVINFMPWLMITYKPDQTNLTAQIVFSVMHREGSGGFSEGLRVSRLHSEEKLIASF